jgi:hypothetical protein
MMASIIASGAFTQTLGEKRVWSKAREHLVFLI